MCDTFCICICELSALLDLMFSTLPTIWLCQESFFFNIVVTYAEETLEKRHMQQATDTKELSLFWKLLPVLLENAAPTSRLHDCGIYDYTVREVAYPADWDNQENMVSFITILSKKTD